MAETPAGIVAVGTYIPQSYITGPEIARLTGIPADVITRKFGITRKPVAGPDDHTNAMALRAAQDALSGSGIAADDIDVVLCTTEEWKEYPLWTAGIKLAYDLGARRAWAIDVQLRCSTTVAAIKLAHALMIAEPDVNTVLIAGGYRNGDLVDYGNPRSRFLINLSAGGGALILQRGYPRNHVLSSALIVDGAFSLDVIVPVGGTVEPATPTNLAAGRNKLDVPDPEGMKQRLDALSMQNFLRVIDTALAQSGHSRADIGYLNILHMKRSAHDFVLKELGLRDEQASYLSDYGHIGQQDAMVSIKLGLESGRLKDGDLMVIVAAGIGYAWGASVIQWG
ncbi:MAG: 3-oxoacyl-ACP synthase [Chloroflexota bacterium]